MEKNILTFLLILSLQFINNNNSYTQNTNPTDNYSKWSVGLFVSTPVQRTWKPYFDDWVDYYMEYAFANKTRNEVHYPIMGISGNHYINENTGIRLRYGISSLCFSSFGKYSFADSTGETGYDTVNNTIKQFNQQFSIGIFKKVDYKCFSFQVGIDFMTNLFGKVKVTYYGKEYHSYPGGWYYVSNEGTRTLGNSYSIGLSPVLVINYNLNKFSLGIDTQLPYMYSNFGEDDISHGTMTQEQNPPASIDGTTVNDLSYKMGYKKIGFDDFSGTIFIVYNF